MCWKNNEWEEKNQEELRRYLLNRKEEAYQIFQRKLIPGENNIIGIRLPVLWNIAKEIVQGNYVSYLNSSRPFYYEEKMLKGFVICLMKDDFNVILTYVTKYVPLITDWSVCDSFCTGMKCFQNHQESGYQFLQTYLASKKEFERRFAIVMLMKYYINDEYIERVLTILKTSSSDEYYENMAIAWTIQMCFVKYREKTIHFLEQMKIEVSNKEVLEESKCENGRYLISKFTFMKALQKITESRCVSDEDKSIVRKLRI